MTAEEIRKLAFDGREFWPGAEITQKSRLLLIYAEIAAQLAELNDKGGEVPKGLSKEKAK